MKHALVIYNPVSGHRKLGDAAQTIRQTLEDNGFTWRWHETKPKQNLSDLLKEPFDRIVVCGGDGTVAETVKALILSRTKTPLVLIPTGSANLLALTLGIPFFQVRRALELGLTGTVRTLDVMRVNRTHFGVIAVGRGYDAFLMQETPRKLKRKLGLFAYAWVFLKTFLFYRSRPFKLTIDGERSTVFAKSIMVFNLIPLPFLKIHPHDGVLNVLMMKSSGILEQKMGKTISIKSPKEFSFQVDGELLHRKVVNIETLPAALTVVCKK